MTKLGEEFGYTPTQDEIDEAMKEFDKADTIDQDGVLTYEEIEKALI